MDIRKKVSFFKDKAGYTATPVACRWAGAVFELLKHLGRSGEAKDRKNKKQGRIHGRTVADGWAGAVMQKPLAIQKCDWRTDQRTDMASC